MKKVIEAIIEMAIDLANVFVKAGNSSCDDVLAVNNIMNNY